MKAILFLGDIAIFFGSLAATIVLRYGIADFAVRFEAHIVPFSLLLVFWIGALWIADLYRSKTLANPVALLNALGGAVAAAGTISVLFFYLFEDRLLLAPKTNLAIFAFVFFALEYLWRGRVLRHIKAVSSTAIVIGSSPLIRETVAWLEKHPGECRVLRTFPALDPKTTPELLRALEETRPSMLVVPSHLSAGDLPMEILAFLLLNGAVLIRFADLYEMTFDKVLLEELDERWIADCLTRERSRYDIVKRALDIAGALTLGALFLLPATGIALAIVLTSPGPVIYTQSRRGRGNRPFTVYKFRTMRAGTDGAGWPLWTEENDRRVTPLGQILRFTHLDEVPQLWNILRGEISFVGPRAERVELADQFEKLPGYGLRHLIKPGLTGWAQLNYPPSMSLDQAKEKLRYDLYYIKNRSHALDLSIIVKTARRLMVKF